MTGIFQANYLELVTKALNYYSKHDFYKCFKENHKPKCFAKYIMQCEISKYNYLLYLSTFRIFTELQNDNFQKNNLQNVININA